MKARVKYFSSYKAKTKGKQPRTVKVFWGKPSEWVLSPCKVVVEQ